jgi:hypothetical protein
VNLPTAVPSPQNFVSFLLFVHKFHDLQQYLSFLQTGESNQREFHPKVISKASKVENSIKEVIQCTSEEEEAKKTVKLGGRRKRFRGRRRFLKSCAIASFALRRIINLIERYLNKQKNAVKQKLFKT